MSRYHRISPCPKLAPYLEELLIEDAEGAAPPPPEPYRVLPKPYPVMGFQMRGRLSVIRGSGPEPLSRAGVTGLHDSFRLFQGDPETRSVLAVFKPHGVFPFLGGLPMRELTENHLGLGDLLSPAAVRPVEERLTGSGTPGEVAAAVQDLLLTRLRTSRVAIHPAVAWTSERIVHEQGMVRIEELSRRAGLSRRQLERLFLSQVGAGPKALASLARFDGAVRRLAGRTSWADLAHEAGYADQAHLVRDFVQRTGAPPTRFDPAAAR